MTNRRRRGGQSTWKQYARRVDGKDGYTFGDLIIRPVSNSIRQKIGKVTQYTIQCADLVKYLPSWVPKWMFPDEKSVIQIQDRHAKASHQLMIAFKSSSNFISYFLKKRLKKAAILRFCYEHEININSTCSKEAIARALYEPLRASMETFMKCVNNNANKKISGGGVDISGFFGKSEWRKSTLILHFILFMALGAGLWSMGSMLYPHPMPPPMLSPTPVVTGFDPLSSLFIVLVMLAFLTKPLQILKGAAEVTVAIELTLVITVIAIVFALAYFFRLVLRRYIRSHKHRKG